MAKTAAPTSKVATSLSGKEKSPSTKTITNGRTLKVATGAGIALGITSYALQQGDDDEEDWIDPDDDTPLADKMADTGPPIEADEIAALDPIRKLIRDQAKKSVMTVLEREEQRAAAKEATEVKTWSAPTSPEDLIDPSLRDPVMDEVERADEEFEASLKELALEEDLEESDTSSESVESDTKDGSIEADNANSLQSSTGETIGGKGEASSDLEDTNDEALGNMNIPREWQELAENSVPDTDYDPWDDDNLLDSLKNAETSETSDFPLAWLQGNGPTLEVPPGATVSSVAEDDASSASGSEVSFEPLISSLELSEEQNAEKKESKSWLRRIFGRQTSDSESSVAKATNEKNEITDPTDRAEEPNLKGIIASNAEDSDAPLLWREREQQEQQQNEVPSVPPEADGDTPLLWLEERDRQKSSESTTQFPWNEPPKALEEVPPSDPSAPEPSPELDSSSSKPVAETNSIAAVETPPSSPDVKTPSSTSVESEEEEEKPTGVTMEDLESEIEVSEREDDLSEGVEPTIATVEEDPVPDPADVTEESASIPEVKIEPEATASPDEIAEDVEVGTDPTDVAEETASIPEVKVEPEATASSSETTQIPDETVEEDVEVGRDSGDAATVESNNEEASNKSMPDEAVSTTPAIENDKPAIVDGDNETKINEKKIETSTTSPDSTTRGRSSSLLSRLTNRYSKEKKKMVQLPRSREEQLALQKKYAALPLEERAYQILLDLGMIDEN